MDYNCNRAGAHHTHKHITTKGTCKCKWPPDKDIPLTAVVMCLASYQPNFSSPAQGLSSHLCLRNKTHPPCGHLNCYRGVRVSHTHGQDVNKAGIYTRGMTQGTLAPMFPGAGQERRAESSTTPDALSAPGLNDSEYQLAHDLPMVCAEDMTATIEKTPTLKGRLFYCIPGGRHNKWDYSAVLQQCPPSSDGGPPAKLVEGKDHHVIGHMEERGDARTPQRCISRVQL
ncbi:hypothetical protein llap_9958 [Limosa lapponica baueri]|uniref:Uncharacterized protein n=1 Tax=Limosa lapponica baueri TaxID=1758121 RepID=A0A2I0U0X1_LIMLA|nr:hypothetical protein llap_9958 [Limosa lapponica baueri]